MLFAISITGYTKPEYFNRAINYYSNQFPKYHLYLCHNNENKDMLKNLEIEKNIACTKVLSINNGFHAGAIDVINGELSNCIENYDYILAIHNDILVYNLKWVEAIFKFLTIKNLAIAGTELIWGTKGINTEYFFINCQLAKQLKLFPLINTSLPPLKHNAENCFEHNINRIGRQYFYPLRPPRPSYGFFPDIHLIHEHDSKKENEILNSLNLSQYSIDNFK